MNSIRRWAPVAGVLSLLCSVALGGPNAWTRVGPNGGATASIAVSPGDPNTLLAAAGSGIFRSTNGGSDWTRSSAMYANAKTLNFAPNNANRVIAGSGNLLLSEDGGQSFNRLPDEQQPPDKSTLVARFNSDGSYLFVTTWSGHLYRSGNLGASWEDVTGPWSPGTVDGFQLATAPGAPNTLYVAMTGHGVYRSTDAGDHWMPAATGPASGVLGATGIAVKPGQANRVEVGALDGIWSSPDGGATWTHPLSTYVYSTAFDPATPANVMVVTSSGVWRSTNSGDSFSLVGAVSPNYYEIHGLVYAGSRLFLASSDGPLVSSDGSGTNFTLATNGLVAGDVASFSVSDDGTAFAVFGQGPFGVFRKAGNAAWSRTDDSTLGAGLVYRYLRHITVASQDANVLYAVTAQDHIRKSTDGGVSWTDVSGPTGTLQKVVVDPSNIQTAYVGSYNEGVWKTVNGGGLWSRSSTGLPANYILSLTIDRANPNVLYAATQFTGTTGVYKSTDGGASWQPTGASPQNIPGFDVAIDPENSNVVTASFGGAMHRTTDGGASWLPKSTWFSTRAISIDQAQPKTLINWINDGVGGFARSVTDGLQWEDGRSIVDAAQGWNIDNFATDPAHPGHLYASFGGNGIFEYDVANDLSVELSVLGTPAPGASFEAKVTIRNAGPSSASPSQLTVTIPAFLDVTLPAGCTKVTTSISCPVPSFSVLSPSEYSVSFPLKAPATRGSGTFTAQLTPHELDPETGNNTASKVIDSGKVADLGVTITSVAQTVAVNDGITLSFKVTNAGPDSANNGHVVITLPSGVTMQTVTQSPGPCKDILTRTITCDLTPVMAKDGTATFSLNGNGVVAGSQVVSVGVQSDVPDETAGNNTAVATFTINAPVTTPPPSTGGGGGSSGSASGGGGGGSYDALALLLLGGLLVRRRRNEAAS